MAQDTSFLPDVSVIIVNWNSREFLRQCLRTVFQHAGNLQFEVIVIDNASYDGSEDMVRQDFPVVNFIQSQENLGFARANNAAVNYSSGRNLLFLNPDTEVVGPAINRMVNFLDANPGAGAIGCKLLNTDGSLQTSCVQAFPTVLNQVLDSDFLRQVFPRSSLWGTQAFLDEHAAPVEVEALSGACILVRRKAFLEVGQFTEDYFMYAEDIDLCYKLYKAGFRNHYIGDVCVIHHGGQSSGASSESQFGNILMRESKSKFLRLHHGTHYARVYRVALALAALTRLSALVLARVVGLGLYKSKALDSALRKWIRVFQWTVGAERWVHNPVAVPCRQNTKSAESSCLIETEQGSEAETKSGTSTTLSAITTHANVTIKIRVLLLGATFETKNMGVGALASGAISILSKHYPDAEIRFLDYGRQPTVSTVYVDGKGVQVSLVNLRFSWKVFLRNNIVYLLVLSALTQLLGERFSRRMTQKNQWIKTIRDADLAVAVSGGDSFSDIYGLGRFFYVYLPQLLVVSLGTKLVLLPQTIGPFRTGLARRLAEQLMRHAQRVYARDRAGVRDAQGMLGSERERARFCYDLGFILEPRRPQRHDDLDDLASLKRSGRLLVGLNVSGLLLMGGYDRSNVFDLKVDYRSFIEKMIEFLVRVKDADVVLIPHVFGEQAESDSMASASIYEALKDRYPGRLTCIRGRYDQNEIKYLIGQCDFFVGARMHACIAALSQAIPAVGIAYSQKFLGVFETVGAGPLVADPRHLTTEQILEVIDDAMGRREEISTGLHHTVAEVKRELFAALDGIAS